MRRERSPDGMGALGAKAIKWKYRAKQEVSVVERVGGKKR